MSARKQIKKCLILIFRHLKWHLVIFLSRIRVLFIDRNACGQIRTHTDTGGKNMLNESWMAFIEMFKSFSLRGARGSRPSFKKTLGRRIKPLDELVRGRSVGWFIRSRLVFFLCRSTPFCGLEEESVVSELPHAANSRRSHCIRPSKVHLVSMKIFQPQNILTCQLSLFSAFSFFLGNGYLLLSQCSNPSNMCHLMCSKWCRHRNLLLQL